MSEYSIQIDLGYTNTDSKRQMTFSNVDAGALSSVKSKILAINASLASGTDGGMKDFFRSDDYDASDPDGIVGQLESITAASYTVTDDIIIKG